LEALSSNEQVFIATTNVFTDSDRLWPQRHQLVIRIFLNLKLQIFALNQTTQLFSSACYS
jgi:hypothetical protein